MSPAPSLDEQRQILAKLKGGTTTTAPAPRDPSILSLRFAFKSATLDAGDLHLLAGWLKTNDTADTRYLVTVHVPHSEPFVRNLMEARGNAVVAAIRQTLPSRPIRIVAVDDPDTRHVVLSTEDAFKAMHPIPNSAAPLAPPPKSASPFPIGEAHPEK